MFFVAEIIVPLWLRTRTRELLKSNNRQNEVAENLWVRAGSQKKETIEVSFFTESCRTRTRTQTNRTRICGATITQFGNNMRS